MSSIRPASTTGTRSASPLLLVEISSVAGFLRAGCLSPSRVLDSPDRDVRHLLGVIGTMYDYGNCTDPVFADIARVIGKDVYGTHVA
ncbi:MAG: hypothetical protein GY801_38895 [bacterium]|nr:hypothetical protein [bacterium]